MSIERSKSEEVVIQFLRACLEKKNDYIIDQIASKNLIWIDPFSLNPVKGTDKLKQRVLSYQKQELFCVNLSFENMQTFSILDEFCLVSGKIKEDSPQKSSHSQSRSYFFTAICEPAKSNRIYFLHLSEYAGFHNSFSTLMSWTQRKEYKNQQYFLSLLVSSIAGATLITHADENFTLSYVGANILNLIGYSKSEFEEKSKGKFINLIYPEDISRVLDSIQNQLLTKSFYEVEYRMVKKDGSIIWILEKGNQIIENEGDPLHICILLDNTERKALEESLIIEKEKYRIVTELSGSSLWEFDYTKEQFPRLPIAEIAEEDQDAFLCFFENLKKENKKAQLELRAKSSPNAPFHWFQLEGITLKGYRGHTSMAIGKITDIEEEKQNRLNLQKASQNDSMTGLLNKTYMKQKCTEVLESRSKEEAAALLILDIDNFKSVNDQLGHLFGDTVLINIAQILKASSPKRAFTGRVGGDEFVIFLPDSNKQDIITLAESLCSGIRSIYSGELAETNLSCSIGIAEYPIHGKSYMELFQKADLALYEAKNAGKNRYFFYNGSPSSIKKEEELLHLYDMETLYDYTNPSETQSSFIHWASNILSSTKDLHSALQLILDKTCSDFYFHDLFLGECTADDQSIQITFAKSESPQNRKIVKGQLYPWLDNPFLSLQNPKKYYDSNTLEYPDSSPIPLLHEKFSEEGSFLEVFMVNNQDPFGCLTAISKEKNHTWHPDEIYLIQQLALIFTPYLLKKHMTLKSEYLVNLALNFDSLTKLPLLSFFKKRSAEILQQNPDEKFAIIYSDVNNFKYINDVYGFAAGDEVLCTFADMLLKNNQKNNSCAARLTDDNFVAMVPFQDSQSLIESISACNQYINQELRKTYPNMDIMINSGAAVVEQGENSVVHAIDNANTARKSIKGQAEITCKMFDAKMKMEILQQAEMSSQMNYALSHHEFKLYLQPKVYVENGRLAGAEALVRWQRPQGMIYPDTFVPFFEKNGFITKMDLYIFSKVLETLKRWQEVYQYMIPVSVNISRLHGDNPNKVQEILKLTKEFQIPPSYIEFELTETALNQDTNRLRHMMLSLMKEGFNVSIDDFGSGYSSLNTIASIPANIIKLDKNFLKPDGKKPYNRIVVKNIVTMIKEMGLKIICEGVETADQAAFLKEIGCSLAQGYYYSRPLELSQFEAKYLKK